MSSHMYVCFFNNSSNSPTIGNTHRCSCVSTSICSLVSRFLCSGSFLVRVSITLPTHLHVRPLFFVSLLFYLSIHRSLVHSPTCPCVHVIIYFLNYLYIHPRIFSFIHWLSSLLLKLPLPPVFYFAHQFSCAPIFTFTSAYGTFIDLSPPVVSCIYSFQSCCYLSRSLSVLPSTFIYVCFCSFCRFSSIPLFYSANLYHRGHLYIFFVERLYFRTRVAVIFMYKAKCVNGHIHQKSKTIDHK